MNLSNLLKLASGSCQVRGLCGSAKGWFFSKWYEFYKRPLVIVTKGPREAEAWEEDLNTFGCPDIGVLSSWETDERWNILERIPTFLVISIDVFNHKVIPPGKLPSVRYEIKDGRDNLIKWLVENGYERTDVVDLKGEFSHRGGIVDVFPPNMDLPIRIEFFGDNVESIRLFNPQTQCSLKDGQVPRYIYPVDEARIYKDALVSIEEYMPGDTVIVMDECSVRTEREAIQLSELAIGENMVGIQSLQYLSIPKRSPDLLAMARERVFSEISAWIRNGYKIYAYCNNEGEKKRLEEWLKEKGISGMIIGIGRISGGFVYPDEKLVVISDEEIFNRYKVKLPRRRFKGYGVPIREFTELQPGDYVVHVDHGIGKYLGVQREGDKEMLVIQYAEKAKLYVPMKDAYLVERYMGLGGRPPRLNQLGGKKWMRTKLKVERALRDMAGELLDLQAKRKALAGFAYPPDTPWQKEMEDSFIYEETPDQLIAIQEVKRDMESPYPMDRLICGDVGYGKTEVAIRAAFKAVMAGKQVAVLVPTTVLAQQHYRTFTDRLADYPVVVEMLSRFRSDKEQQDVVNGLAEGKVDIVIGTHRLIQPDVKFKDLGLVVIDEEQRFGVRHKEWLKKMKELVDVITMSATPIPRTLYMSLTGIRDMSAINTPPQDRLAVQTILAEYDERLIREAILREINREGQVYFLHNRVETIDMVASRLEKLVPEARFLVAHGQMDEELLAMVMDDFVQRKADVLVCTTIIQSGLDIPNVNTIIIDRADTFGLADLYQLRGRVGRYKHQAYAYLLLSKDKALTSDAKKRLRAIQDFSHLGAGFKIAMQDLEIRGAGNLLGPQQHGYIQAVGFEMYCRLLQRNILRLQGKEVEEPYEVRIEGLDFGYIPVKYIPSDRLRIDFYKRIATEFDIDAIERELIDRFGPLPQNLIQLLDVARIRVCAMKKKIKEIRVYNDKISILWLDGRRIIEDVQGDKLKWLKKEVCGIIST